MPWDDSYDTGVDEIDKQNFELIYRAELMMNTEDKDIRLTQLHFFEKLVKEYFALEQRLHNECYYFDANWHKEIHEIYIVKLQQIKKHLAEEENSHENEEFFKSQVFEFLKDHISYHDQSFACFYCIIGEGMRL